MNRLAISFVVALVGCTSPVVGTWQTTSTVQVQDASGGPSRATSITTTLLFVDAFWEIGGGCSVPVAYSGPKATLKLMPWTCPLASYEGLPFIQSLQSSSSWKRTDVLEVRSASFEVIAGDKLAANFDFQIRTNESDSTIGPQVSFVQTPGEGFIRVR